MASRVKRSMEARSCKFQTTTNFEKERLRVLRGPICPQISPKWKIISAKTARNLPKLRSMAKIVRLPENAKVALRNITIFWWDYIMDALCVCLSVCHPPLAPVQHGHGSRRRCFDSMGFRHVTLTSPMVKLEGGGVSCGPAILFCQNFILSSPPILTGEQ